MKKKPNEERVNQPYWKAIWHCGYERFGTIGEFAFGTYDDGWGKHHAAVWKNGNLIFIKSGIMGQSGAKKVAWDKAVELYVKSKEQP